MILIILLEQATLHTKKPVKSGLGTPPEPRMFPVEVLNLSLRHPSKRLIDVDTIAAAIVPAHPHPEQGPKDGGRGGGGQVETVADGKVRAIEGQEGPGGDQAADISEHDVCADGGGASGVGDDIVRGVSVGEGAKSKGAAGDEEGRAVARHGVLAGEEHDVSDHDQGRTEDEPRHAAVEDPAEEGEEEGEEGANDVGGHSVKLLAHDACFWVDRTDDGGGEEGKALHGDVVEEEDETCGEGDGAEDAPEGFRQVDFIQEFGGRNTFRFDACDGQVLSMLKPFGKLDFFRKMVPFHPGSASARSQDGRSG